MKDRDNNELIASRVLDCYGNSILRIANACLYNIDDAEDVLQETMVRFLEKKPVFTDRSQEKAWLLKVALNISKDMLRKRKKLEVCELEDNIEAVRKENLSYVWEAVGQLPIDYREVLYLYYYEGYSTNEISKILGLNASTVRSRLKRGRESLGNILRRDNDD